MSQILYSDTFGATWAVGYTDAEDKKPVDLLRCNDRGPFFALKPPGTDGISILRSTDGQTWEGFLDPLLAAGVIAVPAAITYDPLTDRLFISYIDQIYVFALRQAAQVDVLQCNLETVSSGSNLLVSGVRGFWQKIKEQKTSAGVDLKPIAYRTLLYHKKGVPV